MVDLTQQPNERNYDMERRGYTFGELLIMAIWIGAALGLLLGSMTNLLGGLR